MKKIILIIIPILIICTTAFAMANNNKNEEIKMNLENKKILIAYFSWGGNTKTIAEKIHAQVGGDMFRIETAVPYPEDYNEAAYGVAKKQHEEGTMPPLKDNGDVSNYDIVFVGTPAWWYEMAPAVKTFLTENNFEGKTVVPFITHGGGGKYTIKEDMAKLSKTKTLEPLVIYERGDSNTDNDIKHWLTKLN